MHVAVLIMIYLLFVDFFCICFGIAAYFSLVQIGHMMVSRETFGNQVQRIHNDVNPSLDCFIALSRLVVHFSEHIRQTYMNLAEALCGMDQTAHDNTCCYIETSKQHANRTMSLKFTVLDNAFAFSFFLFMYFN